MRILLVYPSPERDKERRFGYSLTLLYLAAILRESGHDPYYVDFTLDPSAGDFLKAALPQADALVVELDSFTLKRSPNVIHGEALIREVRALYPRLTILALGHDLRLNPRHIPECSYVFNTEPEPTIVSVLETLVNGREVENLGLNTLEDLDCLPFPARDLVKPILEQSGAFHANLVRPALVQTSRGCGNTCKFCERRGWTSIVRRHSIFYSAGEFDRLKEEGAVDVWVCDDNFTFHLPWAKGLLRELIARRSTRGMKISISSWIRIDSEFLDLAKEAGVSSVSFGLESADPSILDFYGKPMDLEQTATILEYADKIGIYTIGNFIIGAPMETEETIRATFDYALRLPLDQINMKILTYMPGSLLHESLPPELKQGRRYLMACRENGLCDFSREELGELISGFRNTHAERRRPRLKEKMIRHGPPYLVKGPGNSSS